VCKDCDHIKSAAISLLSDISAMQSSDHEYDFGPLECEIELDGSGTVRWADLALSAAALAEIMGLPEYVPEWYRSADNDKE
jgi:hypothetical protein